MVQQGQVFELTRRDRSGQPLWAYRYRIGGRGSRRVQRGGFACEQDARDALERELDRVRRERRISRSLTLAELVETYLAQHDVQPVTTEKLRYLLSKATAMFGDRRIGELTSQEIAAWRMRLSPGYRFEATQALRQVLHRAVAWGMIEVNPAKVGVDNPVRRRKEQHPFESWAELEALADEMGPRYGPMILFAAATGLRPAEWIALEKRDVDRKERVVYVRRSFTKGELNSPRRRRACGQCHCRLGRSRHWIGSKTATVRRLCFPASAAATSTSTTSDRSSGGRHRRRSASRRCGGSTISGTPLRPSRSVPVSQPSISLATWARA
jgi:hypothetical protein